MEKKLTLEEKEELLNNCLDIICDEFPNIQDEMINRFHLACLYLYYIDLSDINNEFNIVNLSDKDIINYAKAIVYDIDPKLSRLFIKLYNEGKINIHKEDEDYTTCLSINENKSGVMVADEIHILKRKNYSTICDLVHEFMHYTNAISDLCDPKCLDNYLFRLEFTEFVSIYFEKYAQDYLINNCNIDKKDLNTYCRYEDNNKGAWYEIIIGMPFMIHKNYSKFNYKTFKNNSLMKSTKIAYEDMIDKFFECLELPLENIFAYKKIKEVDIDENLKEKVKELTNNTFHHYFASDNHFMCTLLAETARDSLTKDEVLKFNRLIFSKIPFEKKTKDPIFSKVLDLYDGLYKNEELLQKISNSIENNNKKYEFKGD